MNYFNNKFSEFLIFSFLLIGFYSCSDSNNDLIVTQSKIEIFNVSYGSHSDQKYDIYLPEGRTNSTKIFILVHGGSWVSGDKKDMGVMVASLQEHFPNYAIVNINYRLGGANMNPFPMQIDDIQAVISHVQSESYQIGNEYAFIGTSAGAHLSMLYSYTTDNSDLIKMVCSIVGPTNFTDPSYVDNPDYTNFILAIQAVTGISIVTNPSYYENLSPYHVVNSDAPPTILFYGGQDELVPTSQGVDINEKLNQLDVTHEFILYENEGHAWTGENLIDTNNKLIAFIQNQF